MAAARKALDLFLSLGVGGGVLISTLQPPQALAQHAGHGGVISQTSEGGEGGEGGEGAASGSAGEIRSDQDLLVVLAQMQGHLLVAQELLNQGQAKAAEPHVGHPVDELYGALQPVLEARGISPFLSSLEALRQQVRLAPTSPETAVKLAQAQQAIAKAGEQAVATPERTSPTSLQGVVRELASAAAEEYEGAVANGQVLETIEYQDARGFLLEAQRLLSSSAQSPGAAATALAGQRQVIAAMLRAFPSALPPGKTVLSPAALKQLQQQL